MKKLIMLLALLGAVFILTACSEDTTIPGKYVLTTMKDETGNVTTSQQMEAIMKQNGYSGEFITVLLDEKGNFSLSSEVMPQIGFIGTYAKDAEGDGYTFTVDGQGMPATIKGGVLVLTDTTGTEMTFEKTEDSTEKE